MTSHHGSTRLARILAAGIATATLATVPAYASPDIGPVQRDTGSSTAVEPAPEPEPLIVRVADEGFDWGAAAIGAGSAGAVVLILTAGGLALGRVGTAR